MINNSRRRRKKGSGLTASGFRKESDSLIRKILSPVRLGGSNSAAEYSVKIPETLSLRSDRTGLFTYFANRSRLFSENPAECQSAPLFPFE